MEDMEQIYREYMPQVYKYLFSLCHDRQTAEELTQETFYQAVKSINRFRGECKLYVWLCAIAKNLWYREMRKKEREYPSDFQEEPPAAEPEPADPLLQERDRALSELRRLDENIEDAKLSAQIVHMEEVAGKIFELVAEDRAKLPQIRRFLNYYLPTTLKLLNAYDRMGGAGVEGSNIDGTMGRIDTMMDRVVQAFDRQLDALFANEALDITTDITVLEQMLAQEGLSGPQLGQTEEKGGT